jgi:hypothetical protein
MSQWLDERQRLHQQLRSGDAESALYDVNSQIRELEERLYGEARQWQASWDTPAAIEMPGVPYEPPALLDPDPSWQ